MSESYLKLLREHLLEEEIIIPKGIVGIEYIVYNDNTLFGTITIDKDYINKKYYEDEDVSAEDVHADLIDYCKDFLGDKNQHIKIK